MSSLDYVVVAPAFFPWRVRLQMIWNLIRGRVFLVSGIRTKQVHYDA